MFCSNFNSYDGLEALSFGNNTELSSLQLTGIASKDLNALRRILGTLKRNGLRALSLTVDYRDLPEDSLDSPGAGWVALSEFIDQHLLGSLTEVNVRIRRGELFHVPAEQSIYEAVEHTHPLL